MHPQLAEQVAECVLARPGGDLRHGRGQRLPAVPLLRVLPGEDAHALPLLGQVGQVEVDGERLGDQLGAVQRPPGDQGGDPVPARARAASGVLRRRAGGDDGAPQLLHVVEQVLAAGVADHLAEQVGEQPDVASQGCG